MRAVAALLTILAGTALAQSDLPVLSNAQIESKALTGDAHPQLKSWIAARQAAAWIGYAVAAEKHNGDSCCWDDYGHGCRLEGGDHNITYGDRKSTVQLEGPSRLFVLYRVQDRKIGKIRVVGESCPLDAGGLPFIWFTGVSTQASLALLSEQISNRGEDHEPDTALVAIAMHAGDGTDAVLKDFASPSQPEWLREKALFWLASARGEKGFAVVREAARHDASAHIREKTMFHLTLVKQPAAIDELIHSAKADPAPEVRKQALFWLSQKAGQHLAGDRAATAIGESLRDDPDTAVKKSAVFALQQLPAGEGVPMLIDVARKNRNPEVRKQAVFWLGQSQDPRALAFFEQVLAK